MQNVDSSAIDREASIYAPWRFVVWTSRPLNELV
jgi:hypothetical protein